MTSRIEIIKSSKLILRDYLGLLNEVIFQKETENNEEFSNSNILTRMKKYRDIFKEYLQNNFTNEINDFDLFFINNHAKDCLDEDIKNIYHSIFNENIYHDLIKNLKEISNLLLYKTFINNEVHDYIIDYVNNYNSFDTWKILFFKCVYILYDNTNKILNGNLFYYTTIEHFNNCTNLHQLPIEEWNFQGNNNEYVEYLELLYSYYDSEYKISSEESDDNDDDDDVDDDVDVVDEDDANFLFMFKSLNDNLYANNALSKNLYDIFNEFINRIDLDDLEMFNEAMLKYNLLCYAYIKKLDEEYVEYYDYYSLFDNFYVSMESINNLNNIYSTEIFITILERLGYNDEFTDYFKRLNHINDEDYEYVNQFYINDDEDLISKFKDVFEALNRRLYNTNCISTQLFNKMEKYIDNLDLSNLPKFECAKIRFNAYCYILFQTYILEFNNEYDVLYDNFYNTWEAINDLSVTYTPEEIFELYISKVTNEDFIKCKHFLHVFKYINKINDNPLKNKYKLIQNTILYECNICFNTNEDDYFKCNTCIFKICASCYNNYHLKYNIDKCSHCRN